MNLVLASASPRRRELLEKFAIDFTIDPATGPEQPPAGASAADTVAALSRQKALEVAARHPGSIVIGADTVVALGDEILGKPKDEADAFRMLRSLSGREHQVYTGVTVAQPDKTMTQTEMTRVFFRDMTDREIQAYIATGEPMDKAGAYGYQGVAGMFIQGIEGDFFNVVGLPLCRLGQMLRELGVELL
jgi:septum formation protein